MNQILIKLKKKILLNKNQDSNERNTKISTNVLGLFTCINQNRI